MVEIIDIVLPIFTLAIAALLTIPIFRRIRKTKNPMGWMIGWFVAVFVAAGAGVANLAVTYYSQYGTTSPPILDFGLNGTNPFSSAFMIDAISIFMAIIVVALAAVVIIYSVFSVGGTERPSERYFAILLMTTAGLLGAVLAGDLLTLFIFWEVATAGAAFLMLFKKNVFSINATLKYLIMIIIASAFTVLGISIVYGITGTLNYIAVGSALAKVGTSNHLLIIAFIFIAAGYAIEAAIVPFHFWLPDAYTAAPASSAAFLSALIDQGGYYILIRVLLYILLPSTLNWTLMLAVLAAVTMIVGNLFALIQTDVKRLIAYICVADVGYNLVAITSVTALGIMGNLYFFLVGGITTALAFMAIGVINSHGFRSLDDMSGLGKRMPLVCLALVMASLSFAGVPPFGGFFAKLFVFTAAIDGKLAWLAIIGVIMSVLQTAYLFRLIYVFYGKKPAVETSIKESTRILIPIFIFAGALIVVGIYPQIVLGLVHPVVNQLKSLIPTLSTI
ncbi:MAG: NADH-quinone oxidoreductase subunit N [Candidatus Bathyarchaeia archaeon]|jgi:proton-translocating NADH-quinone oxidoreductase chain N